MTAPQAQTIQEQNKHLLLRWFDEVWHQSRRETIYELYGAEALLLDGDTAYRGPDEFCRFYDLIQSQFSHFAIKPVVTLAEGDLVSTRFTVECTYIKTQKPVKFTAMVIIRVKDGRFVEAWQNWDAASVVAQVPGFAAV
jgi:predicted SnoaL-like aldol condensation-catalyzing enzyme